MPVHVEREVRLLGRNLHLLQVCISWLQLSLLPLWMVTHSQIPGEWLEDMGPCLILSREAVLKTWEVSGGQFWKLPQWWYPLFSGQPWRQ